jgi:hypothetical protein
MKSKVTVWEQIWQLFVHKMENWNKNYSNSNNKTKNWSKIPQVKISNFILKAYKNNFKRKVMNI